MAPGYLLPPGSPHLHKTLRHFPSPQTQVYNPDWHSAGAAFRQSCPVVTRHITDVPATNNTTLKSQPSIWGSVFEIWLRKANCTQAGRLLAPVWSTDNICRSFCSALLVTLWVEENYKLPTSPSQGQGWWVWREMGSYSLDLRSCAAPLSGRLVLPHNTHLNWAKSRNPWKQHRLWFICG